MKRFALQWKGLLDWWSFIGPSSLIKVADKLVLTEKVGLCVPYQYALLLFYFYIKY